MHINFLRIFVAFFASFLLAFPSFAQSYGTSQPQASVTELAQNGVSLKILANQPTSGLQTNISDILRDMSHAKVIDNLHMLKQGVWSTRGTGYSLSTSIPGTGAIEIQSAPFGSGAVDLPYIFLQSSVYSFNPSAGTLTNVSGTYTCPFFPTMRSYTSGASIITTGAAAPMFVNPGSSIQSFTGWPVTIGGSTYVSPKYNENFYGRQVYSGFAANPSTLLISNYSTANTFTISSPTVATDGGAITLPGVLGPITGMYPLRINNGTNQTVLIVGCARGCAMLTGTDATSFAVVEIARSFGIPNNRTWVQVGNDLFFLATDGVRRYSNTVEGASLITSSVTFGIQDLINRIDSLSPLALFALHHPSTQEIIFYLAIDSAGGATFCNNAIVLNYNTADSENSGSVQSPIFSTMSNFGSFTCARLINNVAYGAYGGGGGLATLYSGDTFAGPPILWNYVSPFFAANNPAQNASLKKCTIMTEGGAQNFVASAYTITTLNGGNSIWHPEDSMRLSSTAANITDITTWPSSVGLINTYPKFIDFYSKGSGRYWVLQLSGTQAGDHIDLNGIQSILTVGGLRQ